MVRPRVRPVPPCDVPGRRRRGQAGAAATAELSPSRRQTVDGGRLCRRRHLGDLDPPVGHDPAHRLVHVQVESLQLPGTSRRDLAARCEAAVRGDVSRRGHGHALVA